MDPKIEDKEVPGISTLTELPVHKHFTPRTSFVWKSWPFSKKNAQASPAATASWQLGAQSPAASWQLGARSPAASWQLGAQSPAASWQLGTPDNSVSPCLGAPA